MTNKHDGSTSLIIQETQIKAAACTSSHPLGWRKSREPVLSVGKGVGLLRLP